MINLRAKFTKRSRTYKWSNGGRKGREKIWEKGSRIRLNKKYFLFHESHYLLTATRLVLLPSQTCFVKNTS
jgi:hypothetical protein